MYLLGIKYSVLLNTHLIEGEKSFILIIFFSCSFLFLFSFLFPFSFLFLFRRFIIQISRIETIPVENLKIVLPPLVWLTEK